MPKVTIDFGNEITPVIQKHLDEGVAVASYVRAAVSFFNHLLQKEKDGSTVGYGNIDRFKTYNTEYSPKECLNKFEDN